MVPRRVPPTVEWSGEPIPASSSISEGDAMEARSFTGTSRPAVDHSRRIPALAAGLGLLVMAVLAPIAQFGVLQKLVVPGDAAATVGNLMASPGLIWVAIAAFFAVAILDVVVAWGLYRLLRPADERLALAVAWLRVIYAAAFAVALLGLLNAAQLLDGAPAAVAQSEQFRGQVATALASFTTGWDLALGIFGLHLVGLGALLARFAAPRLLAALVAVAGIGYLVDSIGSIAIADYALKISTYTFVGEALLIFWFIWIAIKGVRARATPGAAVESPMNTVSRGSSSRSPVPAIGSSLAAGLLLAFAMVLGPASGGSEPTITGSVLLAFGLGWGLMAFLSTRFSAQPQRWMNVPAALLGVIGVGLVAFQPGPDAMDLLSWVWPPALAVLGIWMIGQIRRQLRGRGRWLVVPTTSVLLLFAVGGGFETVSAATSAAGLGAGQLVDVGGHKLYLACTGSGSPTVVLESGLGETSAYWGWIAPRVADSTRVCVYDRAGRGRSEASPGVVDAVTAARDLHALLKGSGNAGPYVMVGHSSGAVYVRIFAATYPTEIAGVVLLDGQPADAMTALPNFPAFYRWFRPVSALMPSVARLGLLRVGQPGAADLPPDAQAQESVDQSSPRTRASTREEFAALPAAFGEALRLTTLGSVPLVVVEAEAGAEVGWHEAQAHMAALSTNSSHRVLADVTHNSLIMSEADSQAATTAILDVIASVRTGQRLTGG